MARRKMGSFNRGPGRLQLSDNVSPNKSDVKDGNKSDINGGKPDAKDGVNGPIVFEGNLPDINGPAVFEEIPRPNFTQVASNFLSPSNNRGAVMGSGLPSLISGTFVYLILE